MRLAPCSSCGVHVHAFESRCPFCGFEDRSESHPAGRVAGAALLGLTLAGCQIEPEYGVADTESESATEVGSTTGTSTTGTSGTSDTTSSGAEDGPDENVPCEMLAVDACDARADCIASNVRVFELDDNGTCALVEEGSECLERAVISDGCAGWSCSDAAPWYEERADSGTAIADVDVCGHGIAEWSECQVSDEGIVPEVCACACPK